MRILVLILTIILLIIFGLQLKRNWEEFLNSPFAVQGNTHVLSPEVDRKVKKYHGVCCITWDGKMWYFIRNGKKCNATEFLKEGR